MTPGSQHENILRTSVSTCQDHGVSEIYARPFLQNILLFADMNKHWQKPATREPHRLKHIGKALCNHGPEGFFNLPCMYPSTGSFAMLTTDLMLMWRMIASPGLHQPLRKRKVSSIPQSLSARPCTNCHSYHDVRLPTLES